MWPVATATESHTHPRCDHPPLHTSDRSGDSVTSGHMLNQDELIIHTVELCMYRYANRVYVCLCSILLLFCEGIHAKIKFLCDYHRNNVLLWLKNCYYGLGITKWLHNMLLPLCPSHPTHWNTSPFAKWILIQLKNLTWHAGDQLRGLFYCRI
jgi:hypothetical protein